MIKHLLDFDKMKSYCSVIQASLSALVLPTLLAIDFFFGFRRLWSYFLLTLMGLLFTVRYKGAPVFCASDVSFSKFDLWIWGRQQVISFECKTVGYLTYSKSMGRSQCPHSYKRTLRLERWGPCIQGAERTLRGLTGTSSQTLLPLPPSC